MKICIEISNKQEWDDAQTACFNLGFDWERYEYVEFFSDDWVEEEAFILNHEGWHESVSHLCVLDNQLGTSYIDDQNPVEDGLLEPI